MKIKEKLFKIFFNYFGEEDGQDVYTNKIDENVLFFKDFDYDEIPKDLNLLASQNVTESFWKNFRHENIISKKEEKLDLIFKIKKTMPYLVHTESFVDFLLGESSFEENEFLFRNLCPEVIKHFCIMKYCYLKNEIKKEDTWLKNFTKTYKPENLEDEAEKVFVDISSVFDIYMKKSEDLKINEKELFVQIENYIYKGIILTDDESIVEILKNGKPENEQKGKLFEGFRFKEGDIIKEKKEPVRIIGRIDDKMYGIKYNSDQSCYDLVESYPKEFSD